VTYAVNFSLDGELVEACEWETKKKANSSVECHERVPKGFLNLLWHALDCGGLGYSPMSGHGLSRPYWAYFLRRVVAYGKNKIQVGSAVLCELVPILAPQTIRRELRNLNLSKRGRVDASRTPPAATMFLTDR
jgi:hypothetical protein